MVTKKTKMTIFIVLILAAIILTVTQMFSVVSDVGGINFRQEIACDKTTQYAFDNIMLEYTTISKPAQIINPDSTKTTICVPTTLKVFDDSNLIYHYDGGVITSNLPEGFVITPDNDRVLKNGQTYVIPDSMAQSFDGQLYNGLYGFKLINSGWSSSGATIGTRLTWNVVPEKTNITTKILSTNEQISSEKKIRFELESLTPVDVEFSDICLSYKFSGVMGSVNQESCTGIAETLKGFEKKTYEFGINASDNVSEYKIGVILKDLTLIISGVTTVGISSHDLEVLSGNKIRLGTFIGDEVSVTSSGQSNNPIDIPVGDITGAVVNAPSFDFTNRPINAGITVGFIVMIVVLGITFLPLKGGRKK
jgi:hypothetical protein